MSARYLGVAQSLPWSVGRFFVGLSAGLSGVLCSARWLFPC